MAAAAVAAVAVVVVMVVLLHLEDQELQQQHPAVSRCDQGGENKTKCWLQPDWTRITEDSGSFGPFFSPVNFIKKEEKKHEEKRRMRSDEKNSVGSMKRWREG